MLSDNPRPYPHPRPMPDPMPQPYPNPGPPYPGTEEATVARRPGIAATQPPQRSLAPANAP
jgi:hypothetical protein